MDNNLDAVQKQVLGYNTYEAHGSFGATSLEKPRYRLRVEMANPDVEDTDLIGKIDSKIGTGFHTIAEEAMRNSDFDCEVERVYEGDIAGYSVGGTCDLVLYDDDKVATICDYKTMKVFPAKKALEGDSTDKFRKQLSIYAYLHRKAGGKTAEKGIIYVFVVGWTARDRNVPRTFRINVDLMDDKEVEAYVRDRIALLGDKEGPMPEMDCPTWMCAKYCHVNGVCPHYNNTEFKDEK